MLQASGHNKNMSPDDDLPATARKMRAAFNHEDDLLGCSSPSSLPATTMTSPLECPNPAETCAMLAKEMNQLSIEEREKVLEDVHGIARVVDEPQGFVQSRLVLLERELANLPIKNKAAYDLAQALDKEYVQDDKLRLLFLRAESFDPYHAACRLVSFLEQKHCLFGREKLTRTICHDDLEDDDVATLEHGMFQQLGERDRAGRKIIAMFPKLKVAKTHNNALRAYYYVVMSSISDDEDAQKRGVVGLIYAMGLFKMDLPLIRKVAKLRNAFPVRFDSIHLCYDIPQLLPLVSLGMIIMGARSRMRFRSHYGSHEECQHQLTPFGIPTLSEIPVMSSCARDKEFDLEHHHKFIKKHRELEAVARLKVETEHSRKEEQAQRRRRVQTESSISDRKYLDAAGSSSFGITPSPHDPTPLVESVPAGADSTSSSFYGAMSLNFEHFKVTRPSFQPTPWWIGSAPEHGLPQAPAFLTINRGSSFTPSEQHFVYGGPVDPQMNDVLFGRGKPIQERPGNVRFREILELHRPQYDKGEKFEKTAITTNIVRIVKGEGGRFLKQNDNGRGWLEVDDASARMKVSHAFRTRRSILTAAAVHATAKKMSDR